MLLEQIVDCLICFCGKMFKKMPNFSLIEIFKLIPELPMSLMNIGPRRVGFSGGGYLRLFPGWLIRRGFNALHRKNLPGVVYLHPRDLAPDSPVVPMSTSRHFKSYVGLASTAKKLRMLLKRYRFAPCGEVLKQYVKANDFPNHTP